MKINTINYFIGDAFKSLRRNKTISIASIITVLITFVVLGIFSLVAQNANLAIEGVQSKVELKVYLNDDVKLIDKREIEVKLRGQEGAKAVEFESKEDAYNNFLENKPRGEFVLVLAGKSESEIKAELEEEFSALTVEEHLKDLINKGMDKKEAIKTVAKMRNIPKKEVYKSAIDL